MESFEVFHALHPQILPVAAHQRALLAEVPGLVPVAKGNGYGFGLETLAAQASELDVEVIAVGIAQIIAGMFPGTSRSAATIFAAMLLGTSNRAAATEFAFLVGIPTMYAASGYALLKEFKDGAGTEDWTGMGIAFVVSMVTAFVAVKWLLGYIRTHRFTAFAIYRIVFGAILLGLGWAGIVH